MTLHVHYTFLLQYLVVYFNWTIVEVPSVNDAIT
jgi:hypothetical protein